MPDPETKLRSCEPHIVISPGPESASRGLLKPAQRWTRRTLHAIPQQQVRFLDEPAEGDQGAGLVPNDTSKGSVINLASGLATQVLRPRQDAAYCRWARC